MKYIITGATGFLGKHLVKLMGDKYAICLGSKDIDLTKEEIPQDLITDGDVIIGLAAICGGIGANRNAPADFLDKNLAIIKNTIKSWHNANMGYKKVKLVGLGSVCSFPKHCPIPFKEEDLWNGYPEETNAPYGNAKRIFLEYIQTYHRQYGWDGIFLIPVNLYGEYDHFDLQNSHVIPALIRKFYEAKVEGKESVVVWGDGSASREFLYAGEAARAIMLAIDNHTGTAPINLGSGSEISIKDLATIIKGKIGYQGKIIWNGNMPNGQPRRCLNVEKAKSFGFTSEVPLCEGLDKTINWYILNRQTILGE